MEVDWGGKLKLNFTSCGCMLMEVDWGGKLIVNSMVHWGDHDPSLNPMDEYSISEVDWGAHDSSYFLYLMYIDLDAKPKDFFTQELWGGLPQRTSSTTLIGLNIVEGKLVYHLALQKGPNLLDHQWDQQWDPT